MEWKICMWTAYLMHRYPFDLQAKQGFMEAQLLLAQKRLSEVTSASEGPSWFIYTYLSQLILSFLFQI